MMGRGGRTSFFHVGLCAADLDRAIAFYVGALDFEPSHHVDPGPEFAALSDRPRTRAHFLTRGDLMVEIVAADPSRAPASAEELRIKAPGLNHLSFGTEDVEALAARIVEHGGQALTPRMETPDGDLILCADPDGVRLELWRRAD